MIPIIDGDILVYRFGFAAQSKANKDNHEITEWILVETRLNHFLADVLDKTSLDYEGKLSYFGYITLDGSTNFRVKVATTAPYKGNRSGDKPVYYDNIRSWLLASGFEGINGEEADDAVARKATELGDKGCIVSIDKDLDQVPGHHYNFVQNRFYYVTPDQGFRSFSSQLLTGDRIDNIVGIRGIGPVKASRLLSESDKPSVQLSRVAEEYRKAGDHDLRHFRENCKLVWLRRNRAGENELIDEMLKEYE